MRYKLDMNLYDSNTTPCHLALSRQHYKMPVRKGETSAPLMCDLPLRLFQVPADLSSPGLLFDQRQTNR